MTVTELAAVFLAVVFLAHSLSGATWSGGCGMLELMRNP